MCDSLPRWAEWLLTCSAFFVYALFERWLGRTHKTPAASFIDLVVLLWKKLFTKETEEPKLLTGHILTVQEIEDMKTLFTLPIKNVGSLVGKIDAGKLRLEFKKDGELDAQASVGYPVAKILEPVKTHFVDKIKGLIPGDIDDKFLDDAWADAIAKLSEAPAVVATGVGLNGGATPAPAAPVVASQPAAGDISAPEAPVLSGVNSVQGKAQLT